MNNTKINKNDIIYNNELSEKYNSVESNCKLKNQKEINNCYKKKNINDNVN